MTNFIAVKIHYDHRSDLPSYLKYSRLPTAAEYQEYLDLNSEEDIGGKGFHECLNFKISESQDVPFYLPPTCRPGRARRGEDFVIFSFTYKDDQEMPSSIVGVHADASVMEESQPRKDSYRIEGIDEPFTYQAEAPEEYVTLFPKPVEYDRTQGRHTPAFKNWGFGLRNLEPEQARAILEDALEAAIHELAGANIEKREIVSRQIETISRIGKRYFPNFRVWSKADAEVKTNGTAGGGAPDREIGYLGERYIYEQELAYVTGIKAPASSVEWISQGAPQSPFDIKTVRQHNGELVPHFIEVKSSSAADDSNIYVSSRQIEFFKQNQSNSSFVFVTFSRDRKPATTRELSLPKLLEEFDLAPIKFKLERKS